MATGKTTIAHEVLLVLRFQKTEGWVESLPKLPHDIWCYPTALCLLYYAHVFLACCRLGRRKSLFFMMLLKIFGNGLSTAIPNVITFLIGRFIDGIGTMGTYQIAIVLCESRLTYCKRISSDL